MRLDHFGRVVELTLAVAIFAYSGVVVFRCRGWFLLHLGELSFQLFILEQTLNLELLRIYAAFA